MLTKENAKKLALPANASLDHVDIVCEICGREVPFQEAFSIAAVYRMPGLHPETKHALHPYQCEDMQHFGCSHEHATLALFYCLFEHIHEGEHAHQGKDITDPVLTQIKTLLEQSENKE